MLASDELTLTSGPQECAELEKRCAGLQHRRALHREFFFLLYMASECCVHARTGQIDSEGSLS